MLKFLLVLLSLIKLAEGQVYYSVSKTTTLSGTAEVITVQQPAAGAAIVRGVGIYIDSSVALTITVERNGSAATTTSLAVANVNPGEATAISGAYNSSNVGTGTVITRANIAAGGSLTVDISKIIMIGSGASKNFSIRTNSVSGTVNIVIIYSEIP